ncbi:unnamed protein product, partial [Discosporangium mesarthrocarpum]
MGRRQPCPVLYLWACGLCSHVPYQEEIQQTAAGLSQSQSKENENKSVYRVGVEIVFGKVGDLWGFLDHKRNLEHMQNTAGDLYLAGVLLTNIDTCKYGSQVTEYY